MLSNFLFFFNAPVTAHCLLRNSKNKDGLKDRMEENGFTRTEEQKVCEADP